MELKNTITGAPTIGIQHSVRDRQPSGDAIHNCTERLVQLLAQITDQDDDGQHQTDLWVNSLGELAEVDGTRLQWDIAAGAPSLIGVDETTVFQGPAGLTGVGDQWESSGLRAARATDTDDPWQALAAANGAGGELPGGLGLSADGGLQVAGLEWMGARAYDPVARGFLSVDPLAPTPGAGWSGNPYSYAGNDPLHAVDPHGLAPVTDAELQAYSDGLQGPLASGASKAWDWTKNAASSAWDWTKDNWEYLAGGAAIVAGGVLMATGVGGPAGLMLIGAGADTMIQKATTGEVNWGQVAVSGAFGAVGGAGIAAMAGRQAALNAVEGAVENVAHAAAGGQPLTPGSLVRTAAEGATVSTATGGTLSRVETPSTSNKLGNEKSAPDISTELVSYDADFAMRQVASRPNVLASELDSFGGQQGWLRSQSESGPLKYIDENEVKRLTIKRGTPRAPGSGKPHIEMRNVEGQRMGILGEPVTRKKVPGTIPRLGGIWTDAVEILGASWARARLFRR